MMDAYLDDAIALTLTALIAAVIALAIVMYLQLRAQMCGTDIFTLRLYSSGLRRLLGDLLHTTICIG